MSELHVYFHLGPADSSVSQKLDSIITLLGAMKAQEISMNADVQAALQSLKDKVTAEASVEQSAVTLLQGLSAQISALKSTTTDPAVLAAISDLSTQVDGQAATLAAAVQANTPAA